MSALPNCPQCDSDLTYTDGNLLVCPMCAHEWTEEEQEAIDEAAIVRDVNGNELFDGDTVTVIQDIKLSGSSRIKQGAKGKNLSILSEPYNDHDIECTLDGMGRVYLKSHLVKK
ncbi:zinc ribbon domain-containing protein YjdM [Alkalibacterium iburiense]|uniref:Zinc ribbon domain-containing protein YjdM n=1 Tax=Alkalibacterium iburiense TaxID=290589 RepID=A0ABN0XS44_9LACT